LQGSINDVDFPYLQTNHFYTLLQNRMVFDKSALSLACIRYSLVVSHYDYLGVNHVAASVLIITFIAKAPVKTLNKFAPLVLLE
jgi:hypothetical protein